MSDKYILRSAAIDAIKRNCGNLYTREAESLFRKVISLLKNAPAADVAEVVRCKDCKYVRNLGFNFGGLRHDSYFCVYNGPVSTGGDDFCSHGELQTNGGGGNDVSG